MNGWARLHWASYRPVQLVGQFGDGDRAHAVVTPDVIEARAYVPPVTISGQAPPGAPAAAITRQDQDVTEVLAYLADRSSYLVGWRLQRW
jgi:hypothetical protein